MNGRSERRKLWQSRVRAKEEKEPLQKVVREWLGTVLLIVAGIVGFFSFYWPNIVAPRLVPPEPSLTTELHQVAVNANYFVLEVTISLHNTSKTRVCNLVSWYDITAYHVQPQDNTTSSFQKITDQEIDNDYYLDNGEVWPLRRDTSLESPVLLSCGKTFNRGDWWEPDEQQTEKFLVYVPKNHKPSYDVVFCEFRVVTANTSNKDIIKTLIKRDKDSFSLETEVARIPTFGIWYRGSKDDKWLPYKKMSDADKKIVQKKYYYTVGRASTELSLWPISQNPNTENPKSQP